MLSDEKAFGMFITERLLDNMKREMHAEIMNMVYLWGQCADPLCNGLVQHNFQLAGILVSGYMKLQVPLLQKDWLPPLHLKTKIVFYQRAVNLVEKSQHEERQICPVYCSHSVQFVWIRTSVLREWTNLQEEQLFGLALSTECYHTKSSPLFLDINLRKLVSVHGSLSRSLSIHQMRCDIWK